MHLDPAIARLLSIDSAQATVHAHGSSQFSSTARISVAAGAQHDGAKTTTTTAAATTTTYFTKSGSGDHTAAMFQGEHASLNAIHDAVPSLCPRSFGHGELDDAPGAHFLVTEYLDGAVAAAAAAAATPAGEADEEDAAATADTGRESLARKLARLHTTAAPVGPDGSAVFGFPVATFCGDTPQCNDFRASWAEFYAENRLMAILQRCELRRGVDRRLRELVERTARRVVPWLLGAARLNGGQGVTPVVVHGDLWSGNVGRGRLGGVGPVEEVVFDPSAVYGHGEYELGIMRMFGGFGASFLEEYHALCPKTEPTAEYEDRISLYELYHHLNHYAIFGGGYRSGAMAIMKSLIDKYGEKLS